MRSNVCSYTTNCMEPVETHLRAPEVARTLGKCAAALDMLVTAVESGGLDGLDGLALVECMRGCEWVRNRMSLVDHAVVGAAERAGLAGRLTHSSLSSVWVPTLRLSPG